MALSNTDHGTTLNEEAAFMKIYAEEMVSLFIVLRRKLGETTASYGGEEESNAPLAIYAPLKPTGTSLP